MLKKGGLGRSLVKSKTKQYREKGREWKRDDCLPPTLSGPSKELKSVTEVSDLQELIDNVSLANEQFVVEKENVVVLTKDVIEMPKISDIDRVAAERLTKTITIPKRPAWTTEMTVEELDLQEKAAFLEWRKRLAHIEEKEKQILTPFEKNIEIWRQLWRVIERSDVLVQVVDARDPLFYMCQDLVDHAKEKGKSTLLLLNKSDLLSELHRVLWAQYFKAKAINFMFFSALSEQVKQAEDREEVDDEIEGVDDPAEEKDDTAGVTDEELLKAVGGDKELLTLLRRSAKLYSCADLLRLFTRMADVSGEPKITIGMVGYPNVGKSSTINAMCGQKLVGVTSTPGKTKHFQTVNLTGKVTLCDCPGLVFPSFLGSKSEMVCNGVLPIDQASDWLSPVSVVVQRIPKTVLAARYSVDYVSERELAEIQASAIEVSATDDTVLQPTEAARFLSAIARSKGFCTASGNPDQSRAARIVMKDFISGKLFFATPPPGIDPQTFQSWRTSETALYRDDDATVTAASSSTSGVKHQPAKLKGQIKSQQQKMEEKKEWKGRRRMRPGATGEEYSGTVHTAGRLGSDNFTRPQWKHSSTPIQPASYASSSSSSSKQQ